MLGFPAYRYVLLLLLWYTGRVSCVSPPGYARVFSGPRFDSSVCKHLFQASRARTIISLFFFFFFFFLYILKASTRGEVGKTIARMLWILTRKFIFFFFYILTILRGYKRLPWPQHTRARAPGPSVGKLRIRNALVPDSGTNRMGRQFNNAGVRHICTWRRPFSTKRMVEQEKRVECDCADEKRGDRHPKSCFFYSLCCCKGAADDFFTFFIGVCKWSGSSGRVLARVCVSQRDGEREKDGWNSGPG